MALHRLVARRCLCRLPGNAPQCAFSSSTVQHSANSSSRYCLELVKTNDYENFLCTLLIKHPGQRSAALAVRAFNVEVAKIAGQVSDPKIGLMRLQFWRTAVKTIFAHVQQPDGSEQPSAAVPDHPVCRQLLRTARTHRLQPLYLQRLIKARERPVHQTFADVAELERYAEESTSSTLYLLASIAGQQSVDVDHALSHLGKAQGIVNMLRAARMPGGRQTGAASVFPQRTQLEHGVSGERLLRLAPGDAGVRECTFDVASVAHRHLEKSRQLAEKIPAEARALLLPAVAVDRWLTRLQRADFQLTDALLQRRDTMLPLAYFWNNFRRKY